MRPKRMQRITMILPSHPLSQSTSPSASSPCVLGLFAVAKCASKEEQTPPNRSHKCRRLLIQHSCCCFPFLPTSTLRGLEETATVLLTPRLQIQQFGGCKQGVNSRCICYTRKQAAFGGMRLKQINYRFWHLWSKFHVKRLDQRGYNNSICILFQDVWLSQLSALCVETEKLRKTLTGRQ